MCSFSRNIPTSCATVTSNMRFIYGVRTFDNINNSFCKSSLFSGLVVDSFDHTKITRSNFISNIAEKATMIFLHGGVITMSNLVSNVELGTFSNYEGIITTNENISSVIVEQCYISNNTRLSRIEHGKVTFIRCCISGSNVNVNEKVVILVQVSFDTHRNVHLASKGVSAEFPYKEMKCTESSSWKRSVPLCMLAAAITKGKNH